MSYLRRPNFLLLRTSFDEDYAPNPVNTELYTTLAKKDAVRKAKAVFEVRRGWVIITETGVTTIANISHYLSYNCSHILRHRTLSSSIDNHE